MLDGGVPVHAGRTAGRPPFGRWAPPAACWHSSAHDQGCPRPQKENPTTPSIRGNMVHDPLAY
eukprot:11206054-Lingulodinium_polyedra.AAC.1